MSRSRRRRLRRRAINYDDRRVDLHMHSNRSDGQLTTDMLLRLAAQRGLDIISITDHDLPPVLAAGNHQLEDRKVRLVHGVEVSVDLEGSEQHLLVYFPEEMPMEFRDFCIERAKRRAERYDELRATLALANVAPADEDAWQGRRSLTRLHLAKAVVEAGHADTCSAVFDRWLRALELSQYFPSMESVIEKAKALGGFSSWAHPPLEMAVLYTKRMAAIGLDALEVFRPYRRKNHERQLRELSVRYGLQCSGGSDTHNDNLGQFSFHAEKIKGWPASFSFQQS
ncbi:MAG: PHP domain-containing protein [Myxococcota bacterium]|nr:PHP domain-containing protein [Myxococcota bacterium]